MSPSLYRTCPNQQSAVNITQTHQKVFLAQFNSGISYFNGTNPFTAERATHQFVFQLCAFHCSSFADRCSLRRDDIYALFNPANLTLTRRQRALVKEVQARWAGFARTGSPNAAGFRTWWPVTSGDNLNILLLGNGARGNSAVTDTQRTAECAIGKGLYSLA